MGSDLVKGSKKHGMAFFVDTFPRQYVSLKSVILYYEVNALRKLVSGFIGFVLLTTATFIVFKVHSEKEEQLEMALAESMEETKNEKEKINELLTTIPQEVSEKGYGHIGLSFSTVERILTVHVADETYIKQNKNNVEKIIFNLAEEIEVRDFGVEFITMANSDIINQDMDKVNESINEVAEVILGLLEEEGIDHTNFSISIDSQKIVIELTKGEIPNKEELEKRIAHTIFSAANQQYTVEIKERSEHQIRNQTRDQEWQPVFSAIIEETKKAYEDDYRGFAYSFHPEPLQIIIKTKIDDKPFWRSNREVKQIEKYVEKIIEMKVKEHSLEKIPYELIIRDKNNKKIN